MPVYKKDRKETAIQYIVTAQLLQTAVIKYMMNEKRVPKKWRYMLARGAMLKASELLDNVIGSNAVFPSDEHKLQTRKDYLQAAICNAYQLESRLLCMIRCIQTVTPDSLKQISGLLLDEITLLKKTLKNAKIIGKAEV